MAGGRQGNGEPPGPGRQLEDRPARPLGERQVQVQVARIVDQVEVVEPREDVGRGAIGRGERIGRAGQSFQRTLIPARRRTASALIASSATRFAAIDVVSAWS